MKLVVNLQSVIIDLPKKQVKEAIETGNFVNVKPEVIKAVAKLLQNGGIESVEEL
jgi:endonuclease III